MVQGRQTLLSKRYKSGDKKTTIKTGSIPKIQKSRNKVKK
jgi:hypothetical protein